MAFGWIVIGSIPYSLLDEVGWFSVSEDIVRAIAGGEDDCDDAYFINVGFDKQVTDVELRPFEIGHVAITDRKILLDFLTIAERADYKYIFLDIRFEKGYDTTSDSALFAKIAGMRDIVCAYHYEKRDDKRDHRSNGFEIADSALLPKCAYNDYYTSLFSSNFTRYTYLQDGRPSVALRMYQDIDGKTLQRHWRWFYRNDGTWCENCSYIPIWGGVAPVYDTTFVNTAQYRNLGPFLMTLPEQHLIESMKGKIVVLGDFEEDIHDTYMSMLPGPYLTYLAYKHLARGGNNISILWLVIMTLVFFLFIWHILSPASLFPRCIYQCIRDFFDRYRATQVIANWYRRIRDFFGKYRFFRIILALIYSILFTLICSAVFLISGHAFNVLIPSLIISFITIVKESEKKPIEQPSEKTVAK